jgi:hypothetical protein
LDNIHLIGNESVAEEVSLIVNIRRLFDSAKLLIVFGTCKEVEEYCFRIPLQFNIKRIGSGFGKKVNGQVCFIDKICIIRLDGHIKLSKPI